MAAERRLKTDHGEARRLLANPRVAESVGISRNWIVDRAGRLISESVGFGADAKWVDQVMAQIDKTLAGP